MKGFHLFRAEQMWGVLLSPLLLLSSGALAAESLATSAGLDPALGTSAAKGLSRSVQQAMEKAAAAPAEISPPSGNVFTGAQYATAGVALRNRQYGSIQISGVVAPVKRAYLYWAYLFASTPPATQQARFCRQTNSTGTLACANRTGTLIGVGADTCWKSNGVAIYRADVSTVAKYNGVYQIVLPSAASATNSGADPWASFSLPAAEGAALVVVGTGARNVAIYDKALAGTTFAGSTSYTLKIPGGVKTKPVLWDNIGADGQTGLAGGRGFGVAKEKTYVNGVQIAGPGTDVAVNGVTGGDWDGGVGSPLPQLFDVTAHTLPTTAADVGTSGLAIDFVSVGQTYDCASPVASVIAY
ncbi:hypothetical protein [Methylosinus trichosporium]|uniref:hypothetical protein n=1 Tax=Methylosinus TaxID=425 RepID=UPI0001D2ED09|nr:hypothetical protein [Methylosinus trichosporium]